MAADLFEIPEPFGPEYPALGGGVTALRRKARKDASARPAHGEAVLAAVRALNARQLDPAPRETPATTASGTRHNKVEDILAAVRSQQAATLSRALADSWRARDDNELRQQYAAAMEAKRKAATP